MSIRSCILVAVALLAVGSVSTLAQPAPSSQPATDYSQLPLEYSELLSRLKASKLTLGEAVAAVEKKFGGKAVLANMTLTGEKPQMTIEIMGADFRKRVNVDPATGEIGQAEELSVSRWPGEAVKGEPKKTESGLMFYELKEGEGGPVGEDKMVTAHYTGWLVTGQKFDSSVDRGQPITLRLAQVIPGWREGVGTMKVGGKRKLIIPSDLAYRTGGGKMPPNATLIFDVEVLGVKEAPTQPAPMRPMPGGAGAATRPAGATPPPPPPAGGRPAAGAPGGSAKPADPANNK